MKRLTVLILAVVMSTPFFITGAVFAVDAVQPSQTSTDHQNATSATDSTTETKAISERVTKFKTELKTKLSSEEKTRLTTKCKASQGKISDAGGRIKGIETSRTEIYKNITDNLTSLSEKLKAKGTDPVELNADIAILQTKMAIFNADLASYKQVVSDLSAMDCAVDPTGFKAALEKARADRLKVHDDAVAVRTYITDTIKPLLTSIRSKIEPTTTGRTN